MPARKVATLTGTFAAPGVSRNRRRYTTGELPPSTLMALPVM